MGRKRHRKRNAHLHITPRPEKKKKRKRKKVGWFMDEAAREVLFTAIRAGIRKNQRERMRGLFHRRHTVRVRTIRVRKTPWWGRLVEWLKSNLGSSSSLPGL